MRKFSSDALAVLCLAVVFLFVPAAGPRGQVAQAQSVPVSASGEQIDSFSAAVHLESNGTLKVAETILYNFGDQERHGIFRDIPLEYDNGQGKLDISDVTVTDQNGASYPFQVSQNGTYEEVKIGDPNVLVSGNKTYVIGYSVDGAVQWGQDADKLIWNVTGDGWIVPMQGASATFFLPSALDPGRLNLACYEGVYGSTEPCTVKAASSTALTTDFAATRALKAREGLTLSATFPKGFLTPPTLTERLLKIFLQYSILLLPLAIFILLFFHWWRRGRDPKGRGTIVPQYEPPAGLSPIEVGVLSSGSLKPAHVSAEIISLAVRGFLKITPLGESFGKPQDYQLQKLKEATEADPLFDRVLMTGLFAAMFPTNTLSGLTKTFQQAKMMKEKDPAVLLEGLFGSQQDVPLSSLKNKFQSFLENIKGATFQSLIAKGYYDKDPRKVSGPYIAAAFAVFMLGFFLFMSWPLGLISLALSGIVIGIFGVIMPKVTAKGALEKENIKGFKEYLNIAEKDRLNFHDAPAKTPELFEAFLPYALALGVVDAWAKEFQGIYTEPPRWYGGSYAQGFMAVNFAHDLQNFSNFSSQAVGSTPSGHGGGGGFSGGGAGGGGGGSW